jgi:hypothetical protein
VQIAVNFNNTPPVSDEDVTKLLRTMDLQIEKGLVTREACQKLFKTLFETQTQRESKGIASGFISPNQLRMIGLLKKSGSSTTLDPLMGIDARGQEQTEIGLTKFVVSDALSCEIRSATRPPSPIENLLTSTGLKTKESNIIGTIGISVKEGTYDLLFDFSNTPPCDNATELQLTDLLLGEIQKGNITPQEAIRLVQWLARTEISQGEQKGGVLLSPDQAFLIEKKLLP